MQLGVSTATFCSKMYTEETFEYMRELGIDVCEIFLSTFTEYKPSYAEILKKNLQDIKVHSIHSLNTQFEPQLFNQSDRVRGDAEKIFSDILTIAQIVGAENYTFHGQIKMKKTTVFNSEKIGKRANELCKMTKKYGVDFCYENVHWSHYNNPNFLNDILPYCDDMHTCLDIKQAYQSGYSWKEYLKIMDGKLKTVHICDYDQNGNTCNIGKGVFDFEEFFRALKGEGFDGPVLLELYSKDWDTMEELKKGIDFANDKMSKFC